MDGTRRAAGLMAAIVVLAGCAGGTDTAADTAPSAVESVTEEDAPAAAPPAEDASPDGPAGSDEASPAPVEDAPVEDAPVEDASGEDAPVEASDLTALATGDRPEGGWPVEPGTYTSPGFEGVAIELPSGLALGGLIEGGGVALRSGAFAVSDDIVLVLSIRGVIPPDRVGVHVPHDEDPMGYALPVPADLGPWFEAVPQMEVLASGEGEAPLGAYRWWDVAMRPELGETFSDCGRPACTHSFVGYDGVYIHAAEWTVRYVQLVDRPEVLLWSQERDGTGPAAAIAEQLAASAAPTS